jgi:hypothetical protein
MTENREPRRPQIPESWVIETTAGQYEVWAKPDGCRAIVLRLPHGTDAVTVRVFRGETAYMDAARHAEDLALTERRRELVAPKAKRERAYGAHVQRTRAALPVIADTLDLPQGPWPSEVY